MKRKHVSNLHFQATRNNNLWEEHAFQNDACESLGGYMWPPRSYSCSFCKREFRSAQALGGHMNVHRRDRARLKQSSLSPTKELKPSNVQNPSHICSLLYDHDPGPGPRASASSSQDELEKDASKTDSICLSCVEPNLSMCSNLVICQNRSSGSDDDDHDAAMSCKRTKTENSSLLSFNKPYLRSHQHRSEIIRINSSSLEDLDLELRLGDPPKVK